MIASHQASLVPELNEISHKESPSSCATPHPKNMVDKEQHDYSSAVKSLVNVVKKSARKALVGSKFLLADHTTLLANAVVSASAERETETERKRKELLTRAQSLLERRTRESEGFSQQVLEIVNQIKADLGLDTLEESNDLILS